MRITVDISETKLQELTAMTGQTKKSPAIAIAVEEYIRRNKLKEFGRLLYEGALDGAWEPGYDPAKFDK